VRVLTDNTGGVLDEIDYDAYGNILSQTDSSASDRYMWTGQQYDSVTGLQYNRARYYDPATGRWTTEDPIGFAGKDTNLYRYARNDPTNLTDPSGLSVETVTYDQPYPIVGNINALPGTLTVPGSGGFLSVSKTTLWNISNRANPAWTKTGDTVTYFVYVKEGAPYWDKGVVSTYDSGYVFKTTYTRVSFTQYQPYRVYQVTFDEYKQAGSCFLTHIYHRVPSQKQDMGLLSYALKEVYQDYKGNIKIDKEKLADIAVAIGVGLAVP
jgi:RHS repeat-associated protein